MTSGVAKHRTRPGQGGGKGLTTLTSRTDSDKTSNKAWTRWCCGQSLNKDNAGPTAAQRTRPGRAPDKVEKTARGAATAIMASHFFLKLIGEQKEDTQGSPARPEDSRRTREGHSGAPPASPKDSRRTTGATAEQHPDRGFKGAARDCGQPFSLRENPNSKLFEGTAVHFKVQFLSKKAFAPELFTTGSLDRTLGACHPTLFWQVNSAQHVPCIRLPNTCRKKQKSHSPATR